MTTIHRRSTTKPLRRDGWTPARRRQFLKSLATTANVRSACTGVGLSRQAAYQLRRRDSAFARAWDAALQRARDRAAEAFYAAMPEKLLRTVSELSTMCKAGERPRSRDGRPSCAW